MSIISLENMQFYAYHGCFAEEQQIGTHFNVHLWLDVDTSAAQKSDDIDDTVSYLDAYQLVKKEMMINSKLLEHVADRIIGSMYENFPTVKKVRVKIDKLNPPLGGQVGCSSVMIEK